MRTFSGRTQSDIDANAAEAEKAKQTDECHECLNSTDWYVSRFAETGKEIPDNILKLRQEARNKISELENIK